LTQNENKNRKYL